MLSNDGRRSRPFRNSRQVVEGTVFRYRTGIAWPDLPREQFGPWQTVWKRHRRYTADGTWDKVLSFLFTQADAAGKIDWSVLRRRLDHACSSARDEHDPPRPGHRGRWRITRICPCHRLNRQVAGRTRSRPDAVLADWGYASGVIRWQLRSRGVKTVIPEKRDSIAARKRRGSKGGRPPASDVAAYRGRNVVERSFALAKQWRGLATRYDKLAVVHRGAVVLCAIITWLRH